MPALNAVNAAIWRLFYSAHFSDNSDQVESLRRPIDALHQTGSTVKLRQKSLGMLLHFPRCLPPACFLRCRSSRSGRSLPLLEHGNVRTAPSSRPDRQSRHTLTAMPMCRNPSGNRCSGPPGIPWKAQPFTRSKTPARPPLHRSNRRPARRCRTARQDPRVRGRPTKSKHRARTGPHGPNAKSFPANSNPDPSHKTDRASGRSVCTRCG